MYSRKIANSPSKDSKLSPDKTERKTNEEVSPSEIKVKPSSQFNAPVTVKSAKFSHQSEKTDR